MTKIAILVSGAGRGSNMTNIIKSCQDGTINATVDVVIGVNESAAITIARELGIKTVIISPKSFDNDEDYKDAVYNCILEHNVDLICLAGYMRLLSGKILKTFKNRIMNVHPALIPMFYGKGMYGHHIHEAAIKRGVKYSGCTVHFVDEEYDTGPIIKQSMVEVTEDDTPETLAAKVLIEEHKTYREAVRLFALNKLKVEDKRVYII